MQTKYTLNNITRALRLPFISASCLPFIFGSLIKRKDFNVAGFLLGLIIVSATHLSANLINDYFDSKKQTDWQDKRFFGFFGGSKLIQEGIFSESLFFKSALMLGFFSLCCVLILAVLSRSSFVILAYLAIVFLSWQYSARPLSFAYHGLGEAFVFILFGPAAVMGGYFIQGGKFPDLNSFILAMPFGFFTLAILLANEIADLPEDKKTGKYTWPVLLGADKSYLSYFLVMIFGFMSIILGVLLHYLSAFSLISLLFIPQGVKIGLILKKNYDNKFSLLYSSKNIIILHLTISIILIIGIILR
ncbi:MAG: prenyltransferase [Candidatus Omnitrophica bacterium]|nr:prenyltransferase [Candidatus Omnitrophota bacterium]